MFFPHIVSFPLLALMRVKVKRDGTTSFLVYKSTLILLAITF
jgi:hypothetical protein